MLAGPSNAGLADPGHATLVSLFQTTCSLLIHGSDQRATTDDLVTLMALRRLLDDAGHEFLAAHHKLEADEAGQAAHRIDGDG